MINRTILRSCVAALFALICAGTMAKSDEPAVAPPPPEHGKFEPFKPQANTSTGSVSVGGLSIAYQAVAGTLIVHPKGWDDVPQDPKSEKGDGAADGESKNPTAEASMFYVAYFKTGGSAPRPVTF